jgi:hypothetical protein
LIVNSSLSAPKAGLLTCAVLPQRVADKLWRSLTRSEWLAQIISIADHCDAPADAGNTATLLTQFRRPLKNDFAQIKTPPEGLRSPRLSGTSYRCMRGSIA